MVTNIVENNKYWCCKPSMESERYGDYNVPQSPWQGIVKFKKIYILYQFDPTTNEIDDDSNASTCVDEKDLFETKEEAEKHFRQTCLKYAKHLADESNYYYNLAKQVC